MKSKFYGAFLLLIAIPELKSKSTSPPNAIPAGRSQHASAYDLGAGQLLIFGGEKHYKNKIPIPLKVDNTLWAWDRNGWTWLSHDGPGLRNDAKMVYHEKNKKTYLIGGRIYDSLGKPIVLDEFWEWSGNSWKLLTAASTPGKFLHTNIVYDSGRNKIVLFGGVKAGQGFSNELWEWNGIQWNKMEVDLAPSPRIAHGMVYSKAWKKTLITGGVNEKGENQNEIWSWDGKKFELMDSLMPELEPGPGNAVGLEEKNGFKILLAGRLTSLAGIPSSDPSKQQIGTWLWDGRIWEKLNLTIAPSLREYHSMVYDRKNKRVILFGGGGREESAYENPNDVWLYENTKWKPAPGYK